MKKPASIISILLLLFLFPLHQASATPGALSFNGNLSGVTSPVSSLQLTIYSGSCNLYSQGYTNVALDTSGNFSVSLDGTGSFMGGLTSLQQIFDTNNASIPGKDGSNAACTVNGTLPITSWLVSVSVNNTPLSGGGVPIDASPFAISAMTASTITSTLPIAKGGTGATTAASAAAALLPTQTGNSGKFLTTDGSGNLSWAKIGRAHV